MSSTSTAGDGAQLWPMADALSGSMDAAEHKHVVLGLSYLKDISCAFEELHARFVAERAQGTDAAGLDENTFWVPPETHSEDVLGRPYEYFLSQFANAEGRKGGERRRFGVLRSEERVGSPARRPAPTRMTAVAFTEG